MQMFEELFGLSAADAALDREIMAQCAPVFEQIDRRRDYNQLKVLKAFTDNGVGAQHLTGSTGYGYGGTCSTGFLPRSQAPRIRCAVPSSCPAPTH